MTIFPLQLHRSKPKEIVGIAFDGQETAALTASNKSNATSIKRLLQVFYSTSGKDGQPRLDLNITNITTDNKFIITGEDVLTVLERLLRKKPCPFNDACVRAIQSMLLPPEHKGDDASRALLH